MPPQLGAAIEVLPGWERFDWEGTLGGVRHKTADRGLHANVLVTLDKWAGTINAAAAIDILADQLRSAGATIRTKSSLETTPESLEIFTDEPGDETGQVRVRYRLTLLPVADDTLVITGIATCRPDQEASLHDDISRILASIELQARGDGS